jgi:hypothetical protein
MMDGSSLAGFDGQTLDGLQFCSRVYDLFERLRQVEDGPSRLRMRKIEVEKKLIEELLPICHYVQANCRPGRYIAVKWMKGNQQFDAEISQRGALIDLGFVPSNAHLEVTCVMHQNDYLMRELLDRDGVAFAVEGLKRDKQTRAIESQPIVKGNSENSDAFSQLVLERITRKTEINYPENTTLVVACSLNSVYLEDDWVNLTDRVQAHMPKHAFREIYMYDGTSGLFSRFR